MQQNAALMPVVDMSLVELPSEISDKLDKMLHMTKAEDIISLHKDIDKKIKALGVIVAGLAQALTDLKRHLANAKRTQDREVKKKVQDSEKDEIHKAKVKALDVAQQVRSQQEHNMKLSQLFKLGDQAFKSVNRVETIEAWTKHMTTCNEGDPLVLAPCDEVKKFLGSELVQKVLGNFGSSYKKTKSLMDTGLHNTPLLPKQGLEDVESIMATLASFPQKTVTHVIANFHKSSWLYGMAAQWPKVEALPSAAGQLRIHVMGSARFVLVDGGAFNKALTEKVHAKAKEDGKAEMPSVGLEYACKTIHDMTDEAIAEFKKLQVVFHCVTLKPNEVLWIPAGFLCGARGEQSSLLYGIRKSYYDAGPATKQSLEAIGSMMGADSRVPGRLNQVIGLYG